MLDFEETFAALGSSGGGSGSDGSRRTIYFNNWAQTQAQTITLLESYKNFDTLEITVLRKADRGTRLSPYIMTVPCDALSYVSTTSENTPYITAIGYLNEYIQYAVTNDTTLTLSGSAGNNPLYVAKIVGIVNLSEVTA